MCHGLVQAVAFAVPDGEQALNAMENRHQAISQDAVGKGTNISKLC
jgi:hypothetical protein